MWWQDTAQSRMKVAKTRGDELRAEAEATRMASSDEAPREIRLAISGRHFQFGSIVIVLGRAIREDDPRCGEGARA
jgi:hypothetical protein